MSSSLIFLLGNTPELSVAEIAAVLPSSQINFLLPDVVCVTNIAHSADVLIDKLGGIIKVLEIVETDVASKKSEELEEWLINRHLAATERVKLAVAELGRDHLPSIDTSKIKNTLAQKGVMMRYYAGSRLGLSASVLLHKNNIDEYYFIQDTQGNLTIARTLTVQDIDSWTFFDRSKPYSDRKKGMLPPKLARIMVNLALQERIWREYNDDAVLYDPFCGSGTILMEAARTAETKLAASDLDVRAVLGTKENIDWLRAVKYFMLPVSLSSAVGDASNIRLNQLSENKIDFLVTEPFLGKQTPHHAQLPNIFRGLEKMYLGAFKNWTTLLKTGAHLVVVFPLVEDNQNHKVYSLLSTLLDKLTSLGYNMSSQPVIYARPQAVIKRQIASFIFRKS